jgi:soluble cytochrome b562
MAQRNKTVSEAIELIEQLERDLQTHKAEQKDFNHCIELKVVELEKADIKNDGKLDLINQGLDNVVKMLEKKSNSWHVWAPSLISSGIALAALIYAIFVGGKK